ncbi:MAG: FMN-binding protein [Bacillota bacterium]
MKKTAYLLLALLITVSLVACAVQNQNIQPRATVEPTPQATPQASPDGTPQPNVTYKDGTYQGIGDEWQYGQEDATVVILDGRISSVALRRLDKEGKEVDYNIFSGKEIEGRVYPNLKQYRLDIADRMIEKQSYNVDAISGATVSSENWKLAVKRALEAAKK